MFVGSVAALLADIAPGVGPETHVPLGTAVGVGVSCLLAAMWLSRRLTQLQDAAKKLGEGQEELKEAFKNLPCHDWRAQPPNCEPVAKPPIIK